MGPFKIQHFYFTVIINVWCSCKVWLREVIISNIATINWMSPSLECYLKKKTHVGFMRSWGLATWAQGQGSSAGTMGRGSQRYSGEAMAQPALVWAVTELWPLLCRSPATGWLWPLVQVQNTPPGQHGCYQVFYDPGKTRNRHWFTCRIMHLLVQPARSSYAIGGCFDEVPKQKVRPQAHFPKKH